MANIRTIIAREFADRKTTKPHVLPLYMTSAFAFDNIDEGIDIFKGVAQGHVYSRYANPTIDTVAAKIAALETQGSDLEASCLLLSSGMAAISTVCLALLKPGDKILTQGNLYGGTTELLSKILKPWGVTPVFTDLQGADWIENQLTIDPSIRMIYGETPANPSMACINLEKLGGLGRKYGVTTVIDNTFCTPYLQQPLMYSIDLCLHSTTKYLNGHGNSICGAVIGVDKEKMSKVWEAMKLVGTNSNAFDAWLLNNGLKTLALRMDAHCANAMELAGWLESLPEVEKVNYPGLESHPDHVLAQKQMKKAGGMLSFELRGGLEAGLRFMNKLKLCTLAPTLGDVDTLVLHPASSSHLKVPREVRILNGISDGLIRLSVGIENVDDIKEDLLQAKRG